MSPKKKVRGSDHYDFKFENEIMKVKYSIKPIYWVGKLQNALIKISDEIRAEKKELEGNADPKNKIKGSPPPKILVPPKDVENLGGSKP